MNPYQKRILVIPTALTALAALYSLATGAKSDPMPVQQTGVLNQADAQKLSVSKAYGIAEQDRPVSP